MLALAAVVVLAAAPVRIATTSGRLKNDDAVQDWLDLQARSLATRVTQAVRGEPVSAPPASVATSSGSSFRLMPWIPAIAGAAIVIGGAVSYGTSRGSAST